jgi:hypothetical protein
MKTIPALATIAAFVAFVLVEFSFVTSVSVLFAVGLLALTVADYTRTYRSLASSATTGKVAALNRERFGLAA